MSGSSLDDVSSQELTTIFLVDRKVTVTHTATYYNKKLKAQGQNKVFAGIIYGGPEAIKHCASKAVTDEIYKCGSCCIIYYNNGVETIISEYEPRNRWASTAEDHTTQCGTPFS